jgi:OOP family OmpA-OmpF porin
MAHPTPPPPPQGDLEALRRLLLEPEQQALQALQDPARWEEWVARVLPKALLRRVQSDKALQYVLNPIIEEAFVRLAQRNPKLLVDILFPVLLPAIRRAVVNLFASLTQSLNQTLDQVFSLQGLRWRLEALTTGKSFAEVVLSHTLLYRVEQILLIERTSGLLLAHRVAEGVSVQDGTLVSGMLTAIGDFVRDSFDPEAGLNAVNFGERVLVVEQGPQAVLAAVVRGTPPQALQERLLDVLGEIQTRFSDKLRSYNGDSAAFVEAHPLLDSLLEAEYKRPENRRPYAVLVILGLLLLGLGGWGWSNFQANRAWNAYLERLSNTPGLVVTEAPHRYEVRGLRDPLAPDPSSLLAGLPIRAERLRANWQPYQSLEPEIVLKRVQQRMDTPATVRLTWRDGVLVVNGRATQAWLSRLRNLAPLLGVEQLDTRELVLEAP